jgi:hypothetical protein
LAKLGLRQKGRLKSSNIVDGSSQTSFKNCHVDDELNDSKKSVGEELRIPLVNIPGTWMAKKALKTPDNNNGVQRSTRVKYPIQNSRMMALYLIIMHTW